MIKTKIKILLKYIAIFIFILVIAYLFLIKFSATELKFKCSGQLTSNAGEQSKIIYIKLSLYRPWVYIWSKSNCEGDLQLEIPNEWVEYYGCLQQNGDQLHIYKEYSPEHLVGIFSLLSKALSIDLGPFGFFDGLCASAD
jgi:hypothetical protein